MGTGPQHSHHCSSCHYFAYVNEIKHDTLTQQAHADDSQNVLEFVMARLFLQHKHAVMIEKQPQSWTSSLPPCLHTLWKKQDLIHYFVIVSLQ